MASTTGCVALCAVAEANGTGKETATASAELWIALPPIVGAVDELEPSASMGTTERIACVGAIPLARKAS